MLLGKLVENAWFVIFISDGMFRRTIIISLTGGHSQWNFLRIFSPPPNFSLCMAEEWHILHHLFSPHTGWDGGTEKWLLRLSCSPHHHCCYAFVLCAKAETGAGTDGVLSAVQWSGAGPAFITRTLARPACLWSGHQGGNENCLHLPTLFSCSGK